MEYEKLHPNSIKSWVIARLITAFIIGVPLLIWRVRVDFKEGGVGATIATIFVIGVTILLLLNTIIYPAIEYKQWKYAITEDKIEFSKGIFYIKTVTIPIIRIQHIQMNQGPINRSLKLADIEIATAGGMHKIPNLELEKAEEISEYLKSRVQEKVELELKGNIELSNKENTIMKEDTEIKENTIVEEEMIIKENAEMKESVIVEEKENV